MGKTVLIIEDHEISRLGLARVLEREGYFTLLAKDGKEAVEALRTKMPVDLILLDMMIPHPEWDGWRFLQEKQRFPVWQRIPVIISTALGVASEEWARSLGAVGVVRKPVDVPLLLSRIQRSLPPDSMRTEQWESEHKEP
jgi:CheY-like chemotaxis protein